jgi:D12 class N6 adenine-specific DNA methyltransferase
VRAQDNLEGTADIRPFLRWAGSKRRLLAHLIPYVPEKIEKYYEPFLGGGSMFFYLGPKRAEISDASRPLIETYRAVSETPDQLLKFLRRLKPDKVTFTRLTICFPPGVQVAANHLATLRAKGVGIAFVALDLVQNDSEARDLAFHARAPDRARMKPKVRELLGESLDRFDRGDWRPAFEDACAIFEEACRAYLVKSCKMGRTKYQSGSKIKSPTVQQIQKMPMGALKDIFCSLVSQNKLEANLCSALTQLNPDRIRRAHKRSLKRSETALRRRVGSHFWLINNALSLLV